MEEEGMSKRIFLSSIYVVLLKEPFYFDFITSQPSLDDLQLNSIGFMFFAANIDID